MHERPGSRPRPLPASRVESGLRLVQGALAVWLLAVPVVLPGPNPWAAAKDVLAGGVLLALTVAAAAGSGAARRSESAVCAVLGAVLVVTSVLFDFGPASQAAARQWSQVVVGVLLVCLAAARAR